jgi:branched-chain amino acid transport system substrate-binding protein
MRLSRKTPKTMSRSGKTPKLFALTVAAAALATFLSPAAFGEDAGSDEAETDWDLIWSFVQATDSVSANLAEIDQSLLDASLALSETGIEGQKAREVLSDLAGLGPWVVDCITTDLNGTIIEVMPEEYQQVVGISIKDQEHIERLLSTRRPAGLAYIKSVEGFRAMDFASPIFDEEGRFAGAVTVLVRNTFSDPLFQAYPDLLAVATRVETERSGHGAYEIFGTSREVFWTTVDYQGREMRLLLSVDA